MKSNRNNLAFRAAVISLLAGITICVLKFAGYFVTSSSAILSDALESIINVIAASFATYSIHLSSREADEDHLYGHGKIEYFSAGMEGALIVIAGGAILYEAIHQLIVGVEIRSLDTGIILIAIASLANGSLGYFLIMTGRQHHSHALVADGQHVMADFYTSVALIGGLFAVHITGLKWLDPVLAIGMAVWIAFNGLKLLRVSFDNLMDRVDQDLLIKVVAAMDSVKLAEMIHPHRLRLRELGERLIVDFHVIMPWYLTVEEVHEIEVEFARRLEAKMKRSIDLMMHTDPCIPENCELCHLNQCKYRKINRRTEVEWSEHELIKDIRHPFAD